MQYIPRVKFYATIDSSGSIVPGTAFGGFETTTFATGAELEPYICLLEHSATGNWEICAYSPSASAGFRRSMIYAKNSTPLANSLTGVVCSFVAHPNAYIAVRGSNLPPVAAGNGSTAMGSAARVEAGAESSVAVVGTVGVDSDHAISLCGTVGDTSSYALAIAGNVREGGTGSVAIQGAVKGRKALVIGGDTGYSDYYTGTYRECHYATAIGVGSVAMMVGEAAIGSAVMSHRSGVPIRTSDLSGGGTASFRPWGGYDTSDNIVLDSLPSYGFAPVYNSGDAEVWVMHVVGYIVARADNVANNKMVKVEWVTGGTLTQTVLTNGANNISLGLDLDVDGYTLSATVSAIAGLRLSGYLHITKIKV